METELERFSFFKKQTKFCKILAARSEICNKVKIAYGVVKDSFLSRLDRAKRLYYYKKLQIVGDFTK